MVTPYQRRLLLSYALNVASRFGHNSPVAGAVASWLEKSADLLEIGENHAQQFAGRNERISETDLSGVGSNDLSDEVAQFFARESRRRKSPGGGEQILSRGAWQRLRDFLAQEAARLKNARADSMARRIRALARVVGMSKTDVSILELLLRCETQPLVESLADDVLRCIPHCKFRLALGNRALPDLLGLSYNTCSARLSPNGPLVRKGLVHVDEDGDIGIVDRLKRLAFATADATRDVGQLLFGAAPPGDLLWSDFDHVAEGRDHVERLIEGALKAN